MRGMHFESANPDFLQPLDFRTGVGNKFRMDGAEREKALWLGRTIARNPIIHFGPEADNFRADVIDQPSALDLSLVEELQEFRRAGREPFNVGVVLPAMLNQFQRARIELIERLYVDMNINDGRQVARCPLERVVFFRIEAENNAAAG